MTFKDFCDKLVTSGECTKFTPLQCGDCGYIPCYCSTFKEGLKNHWDEIPDGEEVENET